MSSILTVSAICIAFTVVACGVSSADADAPDARPTTVVEVVDAAPDHVAAVESEHDAGADVAPRSCLPSGRIVAVGDSITAGWPPDAGYPVQLATMLGRPVENLGRGGTYSDQMVDVPIDGGAATILVISGYNDMASAHRSPVETVIARREAYAARQLARGHKRVLQLAIIRGHGWAEMDAKRVLVNAHFGATYLRDDAQIGDLANLEDKAWYLDRIHPTPQGYARMAEYARRELERCP